MPDLTTEVPAPAVDVLDLETELLLDALDELPDGFTAEIVDDEIHLMSPTGQRPSRAAARIFLSLSREEARTAGQAYTDGVGFLTLTPRRRSFSPDASFHYGTAADLASTKYVRGAPAFAAEVRSESDYGPRMEAKLARKRADYFAAGTQVVWDVDLLGDDTVRVYRADRPDTPDVYRRGEVAEAEPAVPGWRFAVDELFA